MTLAAAPRCGRSLFLRARRFALLPARAALLLLRLRTALPRAPAAWLVRAALANLELASARPLVERHFDTQDAVAERRIRAFTIYAIGQRNHPIEAAIRALAQIAACLVGVRLGAP